MFAQASDVRTSSPAATAEAQLLPFSPGRVVMTRGVAGLVSRTQISPMLYLARHLHGDWGDLVEKDWEFNDLSLKEGGRLFSSYTVGQDHKMYIITEWDRSVTTLLLPSEY